MMQTTAAVHSPRVAERLERSEKVLHWMHDSLDGQRIPRLPQDKRTQLAGACWHMGIEHSMSIVLLVDQTMYGSAMALIRPCFEAYFRGMWLLRGASDEEVDRAGGDEFPNSSNKMLADIERSGLDFQGFTRLKAQWWGRLCSFTHTGYQQIGARLTADGLGYGYEDSEIEQALQWADSIGIMCVIAVAGLGNNEALARQGLELLRTS